MNGGNDGNSGVTDGLNARTPLRDSLITGGEAIAGSAPTDRLEPLVGGTVVISGTLVELSGERSGPEPWPEPIAPIR